MASRVRERRRRSSVICGVVLAVVVAACSTSSVSPDGTDKKEERTGLIAITCYSTQRAVVDPIRVDDASAVPHLHDFFGASAVADHTDADQLQRMENNCLSPGDKSSYWVPTMFVEEKPIDPVDLAVYLTSSTTDNSEVVPPTGLELISYRSAWMCARNGFIAPQLTHCPANAVTRLVLEFPHCWDGETLQFSATTPHVVSADDECPPSHPVALPRFHMEVRYDLSGVDDLTKVSFSSGGQRSVHGDMLLAWDEQLLQREIKSCLHRDVTCGQTWSTEIGA